MTLTLSHYLALSGLLFTIGLFGVLTRRNVIGILMSIELMLNAANINFVAFNRFLYPAQHHGHLSVIFIITLAAAEVVVGLALVMAIYKNIKSVYVEDYNILKG
ncbi:MAG: NADH-quinone oxidoreductase subunit K [Elusimicrobia bacterium RIFCSPLOWO2_02_FULL_61_11]|nr:MAG: NADH-quinone oxidoreductase subunit K [Elusimicrobia bacterium RIFCSPLOWO2_02_FULL_61_11]